MQHANISGRKARLHSAATGFCVVSEFIVLSRVGMVANAFFTVGAETDNVVEDNFCKERQLMKRTAPNCQREDCGRETRVVDGSLQMPKAAAATRVRSARLIRKGSFS